MSLNQGISVCVHDVVWMSSSNIQDAFCYTKPASEALRKHL